MTNAKKHTLALSIAMALTGPAVSAPKIPADSASSPTNRATVAITVPAAVAQVYCTGTKIMVGSTCTDVATAVQNTIDKGTVVIPNQAVPSGSLCGSVIVEDNKEFSRGPLYSEIKCNGYSILKLVSSTTVDVPLSCVVGAGNNCMSWQQAYSYVANTYAWNCPTGYTISKTGRYGESGYGESFYSCAKN